MSVPLGPIPLLTAPSPLQDPLAWAVCLIGPILVSVAYIRNRMSVPLGPSRRRMLYFHLLAGLFVTLGVFILADLAEPWGSSLDSWYYAQPREARGDPHFALLLNSAYSLAKGVDGFLFGAGAVIILFAIVMAEFIRREQAKSDSTS